MGQTRIEPEAGVQMRRLWNSRPIKFIRELVELYFSAHVSRSAAELAYFLILTFFPLLICINAFVGTLHLDINLLLDTLERFLPGEVALILADYVRYITENQSRVLLLTGVFSTLVFASAAVRALMKIMEEIYEKIRYHGVRRVLASVGFSVLLLLTMYLSAVAVLTGNWFINFLENHFHLPVIMHDWQWLRFVILFALVLFFILLLYQVTAPIGKPRPPVLSGAFLAAVALAAASVLFSWFIGLSSRYSLVYGSLASVVIMLVWLYLCGNILILGNVFNCVWYRHKKARLRAEED